MTLRIPIRYRHLAKIVYMSGEEIAIATKINHLRFAPILSFTERLPSTIVVNTTTISRPTQKDVMHEIGHIVWDYEFDEDERQWYIDMYQQIKTTEEIRSGRIFHEVRVEGIGSHPAEEMFAIIFSKYDGDIERISNEWTEIIKKLFMG